MSRVVAFALALLLAAAAWAQDVLPVPALTGRVVDQTATLTAEQRGALEAKLAAFEAQSGPQIVVLLVPTTAPEDIAAYGQRVADQWKIGRRDVGDGLVLVVAKNDRRVRIEVAKALEGAVPDLAARQIIDRAIAPAFRAGDYAGGLNQAVDQLMARIRGEALPEPAKRSAQPGAQWEELALFFFVGVAVVGSVISRIVGRKLGTLVTAGGAGALAWVITSSLLLAAGAAFVALIVVGLFGGASALRGLRGGPPVIGGWGGGGGWSGGGGGGGFSSGGGGDFGGGGASGGW